MSSSYNNGSNRNSSSNSAVIVGTHSNDTLNGTNKDETITGKKGNDVINGGGGNDKIDGGDGNDLISGGAGNDKIEGGNGNDTIDGGTGNDTIDGGKGDDHIAGGDGNDNIRGDEGNDIILGGAGDDTLSGDDGNDYIEGGSGKDSIDGGSGNDYIHAGEGDDKVYGGRGNDTLYGGLGNDIVVGGTGKDYIEGGNNSGTFTCPQETLQVQFKGTDAAYKNSFGYYIKDVNGNPTTGEIIWANIKNVSYNTIAEIAGVDPDSVGFFLIPNGGALNSGLSNGDDVYFEYSGGSWKAKLESNDQTLQGQGAFAYFDKTSLNPDSFAHVKNVCGNLGWEDLFNGGDKDYNDALFKISQGNTFQYSGGDNLWGGDKDGHGDNSTDTFVFNKGDSLHIIHDFEVCVDILQINGYLASDAKFYDVPEGTFIKLSPTDGILLLGIDADDVDNKVLFPNDAPVIISPDNAVVSENTTFVLDVQSTDPDGETENGGGLKYSITGGVDAALFAIDVDSGVVTFVAPPNYENPQDSGMDNIYDFQVTVTDQDGATDSQDIAVTVNNVNEGPSITSPDNATVDENTTFVLDVQSSDPDGETENGGGLVYSISGGADAAFFNIDMNTGALSFNMAPNYENPLDAGTDNIYNVQVMVTDQFGTGLFDNQDITVTINDVFECLTPTIFTDENNLVGFDFMSPIWEAYQEALTNGLGLSLREAVILANNYDLAGPDTICLEQGTYTLTLVGMGEENANVGDLDITGDLIIEGHGAASDSVIDGGALGDRIFDVLNAGTDLDLNSLTVQGANTTAVGAGLNASAGTTVDILDAIFANNKNTLLTVDGNGGAIRSIGGDVTITDSIITGNTAGNSGGGVFVNSNLTVINTEVIGNKATMGSGGGIAAGAAANLTILDSLISGNQGNGGGLRVTQIGTALIDNTVISNNISNNNGGAINASFNLSLTVSNSVLSGNTAVTGNGGGVYMTNQVATITNTDILDNTAKVSGGGISSEVGSSLTVLGGDVSGNVASTGQGGGIHQNSGSLSIDGTLLSENTSTNGGAIRVINSNMVSISDSVLSDNTGGVGGGLSLSQSTVTVTDSTLSNNDATAGNGGGAILQNAGKLTIEDTLISGNSGPNGGAIRAIIGAQVIINESEIVNNTATAGNGGAINSDGATVTIMDSTIAENVATNNGGGVSFFNSTLTIDASTISSNSSINGGGLNLVNTATDIDNSTITENTATGQGSGIFHNGNVLDLYSTIVAQNTSNTDLHDISTPTTSSGYNFIGNKDGAPGFVPTVGDQVGSASGSGVIDPMLDVLADNGGPTRTHALLPGSLAIDAGNPLDMSDDQRGVSPDGVRDIGAYEFENSSSLMSLAFDDVIISDQSLDFSALGSSPSEAPILDPASASDPGPVAPMSTASVDQVLQNMMETPEQSMG